MRLAKRSHGSQRVHIVPPLHNLAVLDGNDRDEPVVVGCAGSNNLTVHIVFEDHYTSILGSMHDERVRAMQEDVVTVARIKCHQCFATINLLWPSRENISKLEDRVVGDGIEIVVAIDLTGQTLLDYIEERVERREGLVLRIGHDCFLAVVWRDSVGNTTRQDRINAHCQFLSGARVSTLTMLMASWKRRTRSTRRVENEPHAVAYCPPELLSEVACDWARRSARTAFTSALISSIDIDAMPVASTAGAMASNRSRA